MSEVKTVSFDDLPLNSFHKRIIAMKYVSHFTAGYSLGTIALALSSLSKVIPVSPVWSGLLGSSGLIGILLGGLFGGSLADKIGRQKLFVYGYIGFIVMSVLQMFTSSVPVLFLLRVLVGVGIGFDYSVGATFLLEYLPSKGRGTIMSFTSVLWTVGYVLASFVGVWLSGPNGWRWLLTSAVIPAVITLVMLVSIPESPRWLIHQGRSDEAYAIIHKHFGKNVIIEGEIAHEEKLPYKELFGKKYIKSVAFVSLFYLANVIPYFAVYTFLPSILDTFGLAQTFTIDLLLNVFLLFGVIWCAIMLTRMPRKKLGTYSNALCAIGLILIAAESFLPTWLVVVGFFIFAFMISATGGFSQVLPGEVMPTELRASGVGFITAVSRVGSAIGTFLVPILMGVIGTKWIMVVYAVICAAAAILSWIMMPDARAQGLAEASEAANA